MKNEIVFLMAIAISCIVFSVINYVYILIKKKTFRKVTATIISVNTAVPKGMPANSCWAIASYEVDGKNYTSSNRVQVNKTAKVGDKIEVEYNLNYPEILTNMTTKWSIISGIIALFCLLIILLNL